MKFATILPGTLALSIFSLSGSALAQTVAPTFAGSYTLNNLGSAPGVPTNYGGLTIKSGDNNTLLLGGAANTAPGVIHNVSLVRNGSNQITGFTGISSLYATAPRIDGGLTYGPSDVLFATTFNTNNLLQYKPGSTSPDKTISLSGLGVSSSTGAIQFTPGGTAVIASYSTSTFYSATLTSDGSGTFDVAIGASVAGVGGPEGIIYVPSGSPVFSTLDPLANWMLVSEYSANRVSAYKADSNWLPIGATRLDFVTGLTGAEGAALDPLTNDFLFSTFGGSNQVLTVRGFAAPSSIAPEPQTLALLGLGALGFLRRRRR